MELIYRTIDGQEFDNEADAAYHENCIKEGLMMWDRVGNRTDRITDAFMVYFEDEAAAKYFDYLSKEQSGRPDEFDTAYRVGFFVWNEWDAEYRHIESDIIKVMATAFNEVKAEREESKKDVAQF